MKSTLFSDTDMTRKIKNRFVVFITLVLFLILNAMVWAGPGGGSSLTPSKMFQTSLSDGVGGLTTFWSLTKLGGGISVAIFFVLALGIFLIVMQVYELMMDKIKGKVLMNTTYRQMSIQEVNKLVMQYPQTYAARLYSILLSIFHATGSTQDFHDEIANYIQLQQDRFSTFKGRLAFLSDTAGALGLLGTVWGMFVTFFGGNLDSQRILNGMGLALVTTLIGLVVSIILNFFATEVFSVFNKRLEMISAKSDEFRLWLMAIVHQRNKKRQETPDTNSGSGLGRKTAPVASPAAPLKKSSLSLHPVSGLSADGIIGHTLNEPIKIAVKTSDGKKVTDVPVEFVVATGGGLLENRGKSAWVKTDKSGIAQISWTLGSQVGPQALKASIGNRHAASIEVVAMAQPFIPNLYTYGEINAQQQGKGAVS